MDTSIRIEGLDDLEKQFDRLIDTSKRKVMQKALNAGVAPIKKQIKANIPVRSGVLKSAVRSKQMKYTENPSVGIFINMKAYYWYFLEYGTSKMSAQPFMRAAVDAKYEEGVNKFKVKMKAEIDKVMIG